MNNKVITLPVKGIERNKPIHTTDEGAAQEVINLRPINGAWRNIGEKEEITSFYSDRIFQLQSSNPYFFPVFYRHPSLPDKCYVSYWKDTGTIELYAFCNPATFNPNWSSNSGNWVLNNGFWDDNGTWNDTSNVWSDSDIIFTIPITETFKCFAHLNNILIVATDVNRYFFIWDYETLSYSRLEDIPLLNINVQSFLGSDYLWYTGTPTAGDLASGKAIIYEQINLNKQISNICGKVLCRIGYELYDGSIIGESDLYLISSTCVANTNGVNLVVGGGQLKLYATFAVPIIYFKSSSSINTTLLEYSRLGIIKSVKVFCSDVISIADIETFTTSGGYNYHESISKSLDNIILYEVYSEEIKLFLQGMTSYSYELNFSAKKIDFTQIETFPHYTPNACTLHKLIAETYFNYNERLHLGNITNILFNGYDDIFKTTLHDIDSSYTVWTSPYVYNYDIAVDVEIKTDKGIKYVRRFFDIADLTLFEATSGELCLQIQKIITYPDYRARKIFIMSIDRTTGETKLLIPEINLTSSLTQNVAYYVHDENGSSQLYEQVVLYPISTGTLIEHTLDDLYTDTNRVQVSEQNNVFIYPSKNSYRFAEQDNVIVGLQTVAEELSATRFGQFPVYVFAKQGVWALEQGSGEVLYSNITPLDYSPVINSNLICSINGAVVFATATGLKLISGRNVIEISQAIEELIVDNPLLQNSDYLSIVNSDSTVNLLHVINKSVTFKDELTQYISSYDRELKELFVTRPLEASDRVLPVRSDYDYSLIFNKEAKTWYKFNTQFVSFIQNFYGFSALNFDGILLSIKNIESESNSTEVYSHILYQSRPFSLQTLSFKKLEHIATRIFARMNKYITNPEEDTFNYNYANKYCSVYVFGSPDNKEYKLVGGGRSQDSIVTDILNRRTYASCRYFIVVITADGKEVILNKIDFEALIKFAHKLR